MTGSEEALGNRIRLVVVKALVTLVMLGLVVGLFDWRTIIGQIAGYDLGFFLGAVGLFLLQVACQIVRLRMLILADGVAIGWWKLARLTLAGHAVNQIVPSIAGGDALRMVLIHRNGVPVADAVRQVVVDRMAGLIALLAVSMAAWPFVPPVLHHALPPALAWSLLALLAAGLVLTVLMQRFAARRRQGVGFMARVGRLVDELWQGFIRLRRHPATLGAVLAVSVVNQLLYVGAFWLIAIGMPVAVTFAVAAFLLPAATLVMMLPVSIAGWGVREAMLALGLGMVGIPGDAAVASSVLFGLTSTLVGILSLPLLAHVWNRPALREAGA